LLPNLKQRLWLAIAVFLGATICAGIAPLIMPRGGYTGATLASAGGGVVILAAALVPVVLGGLWLGARGNRLGGPFVVSGALLGLAIAGGGMDGWFWRQAADADLPGAYVGLAVEMLVWLVFPLLPLVALPWWPGRRAHDAEDGAMLPKPADLLGTVIAAAAAGGLILLMLRSTDPMQAVGTTLLSFTIAAMIAQTFNPAANPLPVLVSPALVAVVAYLYVALSGSFGTTPLTLAAWFTKIVPDSAGTPALPGAALALPVVYASAGVLGCTLGLGLAQGFARARQGEA